MTSAGKIKVTTNFNKTGQQTTKRKKRWSNFFLTINPNQVFKSEDLAEPFMDKLDQVVKARLNNIVDYIEVKAPNDAKSDEFIFSVDVLRCRLC